MDFNVVKVFKYVYYSTNQIGGKNIYENKIVTEMPALVSSEVQKMLMRIAACIDSFVCDRWGMNNLTENGRKYLNTYLEMHPEVKPLYEESAGQHKVLEMDYDEIEGDETRGYQVYKVIGVLLD